MKPHCPDSLAAMAGFLNSLTAAKLANLGDIYSPAVEFQDPLNQTKGLAALRRVYEHLFEQLNEVSMSVTDAHGDDRTGFLLWTMSYRFRGKQRTITGTSHLKFAADGPIVAQQDHWDASFPVYGEFPVVGWAMRAIKRAVETKPRKDG